MKSLLQHTLILHTCTQDLNKKLLRDNGRYNAAKKKLARVLAVSYKLISLVQARQVRSVNDFSHRHKLQQFEVGLKGAACFKIFQVTLNSILASFKCQMCLLSSSVLSALLPVLLLYSFCLFYFEFEYKSPGGCIWRGDLLESILRVWGAHNFLEGLHKVSRHSLIIRSTLILDRSLYFIS